ncbi:MAG: response regulator transcription factor [Cellulosilyticaceae bacterium]
MMRILIVEDETRLSEALCVLLQKNKYATDAVYDGISGLDYGLSNVYDLIVLDIMLPRMNGIDVLKELRKEQISTPVLLLTAKADLSDKVEGLDSGADDYLTKPFATEELLARVRAMTRRRGILTEDITCFGDLSLNLKTCELSHQQKSLTLGIKEFQMMQLLLANGKQIITKELLIEKVWGFESDVNYNNVEVYISFLRKKLAHLHSTVEIKTMRGLGYYLEDCCD